MTRLLLALAAIGIVAGLLARRRRPRPKYHEVLMRSKPVAYWPLDEPDGPFVDRVNGLIGRAEGR